MSGKSRLALTLMLAFGLAAGWFYISPLSQAQSPEIPLCNIVSGSVCTDPTTIDLDDPNDEIPPIGEGPQGDAAVSDNKLVNNPDDDGWSQNEPYVALNPANANHLVAGANDYSYRADGSSRCGFYWSTNGGTTEWNFGATPLDLPSGFGFDAASNPGLAFKSNGARIYYSCLVFTQGNPPRNGSLFVSYSDFGGQSYRTYEEGAPIVAYGDSTIFHDKPFLTVDTSSSSSYQNNVYVSWTEFIDADTNGNAESAGIRVARSTNNGASYSAPAMVSTATFNQGSVPFVGSDGTVYVVYAVIDASSQKTIRLEMVKSTNGGVGWDLPVTVKNVTGLPDHLPNTSFRMHSLPTAAIDQATGHIYVAWADYRNGNADILFTRSTNGGATFSAPLEVAHDTTDEFFPWLSIAPNGAIDIIYYKRVDTTSRKLNVYHKRSTNGGVSFGTKTKINDGGDIRAGTQFNGRFIGDYIGVVSGPSNVHALWMDARRTSPRTGRRQQDVYSAVIAP
jgi:hypothetical protein